MLTTLKKLSELLLPRERRQAVLLLGLMLVMGLVEVVGVASILPLIAVVSDPSIVQSNQYLRAVYDALGFTDTSSFLIFLSAATFAVIVGRTAMTAFSGYAMTRFSQMRAHSLSVRLLTTYLRHRYEWFLNRHSADMNKSVLSEVDQVIGGSLVPMMNFVSQSIIAACLIALVIAVEPVVAIAATGVIGAAYGLVYFTIRRLLARLGRERHEANRVRFQVSQEVFQGVKEVKVGSLERGYLRRFERASYQAFRQGIRVHLLSSLPRQFLEVIVMGGMLGVLLVLLLRADGSLTAVLPVIALYAFTALRLLPLIQGIYSSAVQLRFASPILDIVHRELTDPDQEPSLPSGIKPLPLIRAVELEQASFAYPRSDRHALQAISLTIPAQTSVGIVGATGAGKSTLIDLILGLLEPQTGRLLVDGTPIGPQNRRSWQRAIGYVPQHIFLADESIAANIAFGLDPANIDRAAVESAARMAALHDFVVDELPQGYDTPIGERGIRLSGGQRQRVGIARALYHDPAVLVLDEATSALDNLTEKAVMDAVNNLAHRKTIIMIAHRLTTVRNCDMIVHMRAGKIEAMGKYEELVQTDAEFRDFVAALG